MYIETFTGKHFHFLDPKPEQVDLKDIVHALAGEQRFGNYLTFSWTVAQHSLLVHFMFTYLVDREERTVEDCFRALIHDFPEAYMGDMPTPLKNLLPGYQMLYRNAANAISEKFGIDVDNRDNPLLKHCDFLAARVEGYLFGNHKWVDMDIEIYNTINKRFDEMLTPTIAQLQESSTEQIKKNLTNLTEEYLELLKIEECGAVRN